MRLHGFRSPNIDDVGRVREKWDFYIAPGQGFFVKAVNDGTINFSEANQYHQIEDGVSDTFQRTTPLTRIKLIINNGSSYNRICYVYYIGNTTLGFDLGYEGLIFGGGGTLILLPSILSF